MGSPDIPLDSSVVVFPAMWLLFLLQFGGVKKNKYGITQLFPFEVAVYKTIFPCSVGNV